jgi:ankyrin repeat protein
MAMGDRDVSARLTNDDAVNGPGTGKIDGRTALHFAATLGWTEMVKFLAENGADLDAADRYGQTPLMIAMGDPEARYYRNIPIGRYDDRYRAPPNEGYKDVIKALLEAGAKPFTGKIVDKGSVN